MLRIKSILLVIATVAVPMLSVPADAQAGPLLDWIRGCRKPSCFSRNNTCNTCTTGYAPQVAAAPNAYGLQPGQCMKTCNQTCARTVVNYVPYTAYRTNWTQVPVTSYKPVTNSDPCTGCTVTCMRPCTTYTYQMQRVPYTTYRPEYRTENYTVPVTTITNDCATGNCGTGCSTCGTGPSYQNPVLAPATQNFGPATSYAPTQTNFGPTETVNGTYYEYPASTNAPNGTISTEGGYGTSSQPADQIPSLQGLNPQTSTQPVLDRLRSNQPEWTTNTNNRRQATYPEPTPAVVSYTEKTAQSPERKEWSYSPVRLASYTATDDGIEVQRPSYRDTSASSEMKPLQLKGTFRPGTRATSKSNDLNGWVEVE